MRRLSSFLTISSAACVLRLSMAAANAQPSPGGAFLPSFNYVISGIWTWTQSAPFIYRPTATAGTAGFATTLAFASPTANRTITYPNATGYVTVSPTSGLKVVGGSVPFDGSNPSSVATGLATLTGCSLTIMRSAAPGLDPFQLTMLLTATAGQLDVYVWKANSSSDPTLVASTNNSNSASYVCTGT